MKHVGLNVAADPLFTASYTGVNGGLVICVADDPGMHSSQNEQDSRHYARASKTLMLEPSDSEECRLFVKKAFELSEIYDTPVLLRLTTRVAHSRSLAQTRPREELPLKLYKKDPGKYIMMPAMARVRHGIVEERITKLISLANDCDLNLIENNNRSVGIMASGICYQYAKEALGDSVSYLKLGMVYPLPDGLIKEFCSLVDVCYVLEELDPYIEEHCKNLGINNIIGKEKFSLLGEYNSKIVRTVVLGKESEETDDNSSLNDLPGRPPMLCPGCPHRNIFESIKVAIPDIIVTGDIGCYTLAALPPIGMLDTCVCMGASVGMAHGILKVDPGRAGKVVAVLGDSTFIHSGITGLINAVYNDSPITVVILDNSTTGMTGHQDNPATGRNLKGDPAVKLDLKKLCRSVGVRRVVIADPYDKSFGEIVKSELEALEPSVVIAQRPCVLLKSKNR
jgi:indolepyruvate ferredoxin oxidoreductase alpha subunit